MIWVLVHDVARPCIAIADVVRMMTLLADHPVGGLLAVPLSDTVKVAAPEADTGLSGACIDTTLDRSRPALQTPQMFRFGLLGELAGRR